MPAQPAAPAYPAHSYLYASQPQQGQSLAEMFFVYNFADVVLAANAQVVPVSIQILSDSDFIASWINYHSTGAFTVLIQDASSNVAFMNNPVNAADFMGTGQNPFPILPPFRFAANHVIQFTLNNSTGASNTVGISLIGRKVYKQ